MIMFFVELQNQSQTHNITKQLTIHAPKQSDSISVTINHIDEINHSDDYRIGNESSAIAFVEGRLNHLMMELVAMINQFEEVSFENH